MDWIETAKRLAAHPRFRDAFEKIVGDLDDWIARYGAYNRGCVVLDLTHWPTVGVLLGMVVEAGWCPEVCQMSWGPWRAWRIRPDVNRTRCHAVKAPDYEIPGQALAELLLELWGEV